MNSKTVEEYRKYRKDNPLVAASVAWQVANGIVELRAKKDLYQQVTPVGHIRAGADSTFERELGDGFIASFYVDCDSIYPEPNSKGETDYGNYVDETNSDYDYEWDGQWPRPAEMPPLGLPYKTIRYHGPGWVQGEGSGYFIPDHIEEQYAHFRSAGQSKSVAWDLTKQWVEDQLSSLFGGPLSNSLVVITVRHEDVELANDAIGTDIVDDDDLHVYELVEECLPALLEEAKDKAKQIGEAVA